MRRFGGGQRKRDGFAAAGADGEMSQHLLALVRGQCALKERTELAGVRMVARCARMLPGMEQLAHVRSDAAL